MGTTFQTCCCCGCRGGKLDWSGNVVHCGAKHDGDENAARNILVPGGDAEAKKRTGRQA